MTKKKPNKKDKIQMQIDQINKILCNKDAIHAEINKRLDLNDVAHQDISKSLMSIHSKLDTLNKIKLNGDDRVYTNEEAWREIFTATKNLRKTNKLKTAYNEWLNNTPTGKLLRSKIGKLLVTLIITWAILSSAHTLGADDLNPVNLIKILIGFATKLF
jgi:hypothetical protein